MTEEIRKLEDHEIVKSGDLVTIGETEDTGFREYTGGIWGSTDGEYSYPIYRKESLMSERLIIQRKAEDLSHWEDFAFPKISDGIESAQKKLKFYMLREKNMMLHGKYRLVKIKLEVIDSE